MGPEYRNFGVTMVTPKLGKESAEWMRNPVFVISAFPVESV